MPSCLIIIILFYINQLEAESWSIDEVIARWQILFKGPLLVQRYQRGECSCQAEVDKVHEIVEKWRERLADISWFMRCLKKQKGTPTKLAIPEIADYA